MFFMRVCWLLCLGLLFCDLLLALRTFVGILLLLLDRLVGFVQFRVWACFVVSGFLWVVSVLGFWVIVCWYL